MPALHERLDEPQPATGSVTRIGTQLPAGIQPPTAPLWALLAFPLSLTCVLASLGPGGMRVAAVLLGALALLTSVGALLIGRGGIALTPTVLLCAPSLGFVVVAAIAQIAAIRALPLWSVLAVVGTLGLFGLARHAAAARQALGLRISRRTLGAGTLVLVLVIIAYLLPQALHEGAPTADGGRHWLAVDSTYHEAIVATIAEVPRPVRNPGYGKQELVYHIGSHAMAALFSSTFGLDPADALVRVVRFLAILVLAAGLAALGLHLAPSPGLRARAALASVAVFFLLANPLQLLATHAMSVVRRPVRFGPVSTVADWLATAATSHYQIHLLGFSGLWGAIPLLTLAALLPVALDPKLARRGRLGMLLGCALVAAASPCLNTVAAMASIGLLVGVLVLAAHRDIATYLVSALVLLGSLGVWWLAGLFGSNPYGLNAITAHNFLGRLVPLVPGLAALFAMPQLAFLAVLGRPRPGVGPFLCLALAGFLLGNLCVHEPTGNFGDYTLVFLGVVVAAFTGVGMVSLPEFLRRDGTAFILDPALVVVLRRTALATAALAVLAGIGIGLTGEGSVAAIIKTATVAVLAIGLSILTVRAGREPLRLGPRLSRTLRGATVVVVVLSFAGAARLLYDYAWNGLDLDQQLDGGRVASLASLRQHSKPDDLIATTHHFVPIPSHPERSYMYTAIAHRHMLIEGWLYGYPSIRKDFQMISADNAELYTTVSATVAHAITSRYGIDFILVEPAQRLAFAPEAQPWLRKLALPGTLGVWQVLP